MPFPFFCYQVKGKNQNKKHNRHTDQNTETASKVTKLGQGNVRAAR